MHEKVVSASEEKLEEQSHARVYGKIYFAFQMFLLNGAKFWESISEI